MQLEIDQAAREDEEKESLAADTVSESQYDCGTSRWMRSRLQGVEGPFPLGCLLYWTFLTGQSRRILLLKSVIIENVVIEAAQAR